MNQGTLTPGLGFAPSDTDSEETDSLLGPTYEDEEAAPKLKQASTFPIQSSAPMSETVYGTMKAKRRMRLAPPGSLRISKIRRAKTAIYDADEIWDELEEGSHSNVGSPISTRRISFQARAGTPFMNTSRGNISPTMDSSTELPPLTPNEQTTLLRSSTGRSYRGLKSRQTSTSSAGHARKKSQDAVGGWWKMQRWWNGSRSNKDQHDPSGRTDSGTAV